MMSQNEKNRMDRFSTDYLNSCQSGQYKLCIWDIGMLMLKPNMILIYETSVPDLFARNIQQGKQQGLLGYVIQGWVLDDNFFQEGSVNKIQVLTSILLCG
jgi:hypothetical protein